MKRELFVLARDANAKSNADAAVSSAHCPGCGAPETGGETVACEYCGADLADGSLDWVLVAIESPQAAAGVALLDEIRALGREEPTERLPEPRPVPAEAIGHLVRVATADGTLSRKESERIVALAEKAGVPEDEARAWIAAGEGRDPEEVDPETGHDLVAAMTSIALADGTVSGPEARLIHEAGRSAGLPRAAVRRVMREERRRHYRRAREEIRRAKRATG